jgi:predicted nucleic acid-binding protein
MRRVTAPVVVDASLAFKWIRSEPYTVEARELLRRWLRDGAVRFVPPPFPYETANILHRKARTANTTHADLDRALDAVMRQVSIHPLDILTVKRAMVIAVETGRPAAYDAQYVALAEALSCELWTADERLWNAVRTRFPFVRWIGVR